MLLPPTTAKMGSLLVRIPGIPLATRIIQNNRPVSRSFIASVKQLQPSKATVTGSRGRMCACACVCVCLCVWRCYSAWHSGGGQGASFTAMVPVYSDVPQIWSLLVFYPKDSYCCLYFSSKLSSCHLGVTFLSTGCCRTNQSKSAGPKGETSAILG